ncbi:MAG: hypothetical protein A3B70_03610 [Deltaproteobacteria bacterium RIFCSPHIGHO2_02_FULL_40_11]|nr:MAG: hypothetical protein A3B70_03610 [Deltaproteobacteria bacterium RIFCSPHIGHO2_02_FULL_40_11]
MKAKKKNFKEENPLDLTRQLRDNFFGRFNYDLKKVTAYLKKEQEKPEIKKRLIDIETLRKMGKNIPKKIIFPNE